MREVGDEDDWDGTIAEKGSRGPTSVTPLNLLSP
jgi:hypothetical protein